MFNQKGERKGKGSKAQISKILYFIWVIKNRTIKRDTSKKFGERSRCLSIHKPFSKVSPDLSGEIIGFQRQVPDWSRDPHQTSPVVGPNLSGIRPTSRGVTPTSREIHRTCPVKSSPMALFEVGSINRPHLPHRVVVHSDVTSHP
jgi:hypothetical protein